jgi:hypothetical protein
VANETVKKGFAWLVGVVKEALNGKADKSEIPTVPTNVSAFNNDSGYQTAQDVQTAIASAAELPSGGSAGDFLRKTASGVAWQTVPSAESASFGGGST